MMTRYIAKIYKGNRIIDTKYNVISVNADKKYGYFEITSKIYHHEFIEVVSFKVADKIELWIDLFSEKKPRIVVERV